MKKIFSKIGTRKERKVVFANVFSLSTLQGISYVLPVIILPYLVRVIGPERFGLIAFAQAFVQYFMILTDYGFSLSATKEISLWREHKQKVSTIFSSVMTIKIILAFVSFLVLVAILHIVPKFKNDWLVYVLSFGAVFGNTLFPVWFFQGTEKMKYIAVINIIGGVIYAASIFIFVRKPADYLLVPLLNSLFFLVTGFSGLYIAFKKFNLELAFQAHVDINDIKQTLRTGWDIFISIVAINAYTTTRVFAVGLLTNNILTGYYSIAERIANLFQTFPLSSFSQAIYPRLSHIFNKNKARALRLMHKIQKTTTLSFLLSMPIAFVLAPWLVRIACGARYEEIVIALRVLLVAVFFVGANAFRVQFLLVCNRADIYSEIHIIAALLGLPLIFLFIKSFSYLGAAILTVIIEAGVFLFTAQTLKALKQKSFRPT